MADADYKEMYLHLFRQMEKAVRILQQAQVDCEEIYLRTSDPESRRKDESPLETLMALKEEAV